MKLISEATNRGYRIFLFRMRTLYNKQNGKEINPQFHRYGARDGWAKDAEQKRVRVKKHMSQWCTQEPMLSRVHLSPTMRVRLGVAVTRHFQGELQRNGKLG